MPKKKKEEVKIERLKENEKEVEKEKKEAFSTEDIPIASYLEKNGVMAVSITGTPLVFTFRPEDTDRIKELLEKRGEA